MTQFSAELFGFVEYRPTRGGFIRVWLSLANRVEAGEDLVNLDNETLVFSVYWRFVQENEYSYS